MIIDSYSAMIELGNRVGSLLKPGDVILLKGELGAGKTALTRGIGSSLGFHEVTSPTFVISKIYKGPVPLVHVDAYRLMGSEFAAFDDLDLESLIPTSITVIEWGDEFVPRLIQDYIEIEIEFTPVPDQRNVTIRGLDL